MRCRKARKLMHELVDGTLQDRAQLDEHLAECPDCRAELQALMNVGAAVRHVVECDVSEARLEQLTTGVLSALPAPDAVTLGILSLRWVAAPAVVALAMFCVGLGAGRWVWPRETTVTQGVTAPEVREKIVEVEVPVVKERVVVKEVPVVKTRVVYRDRAVPAARPIVEPPPEPVRLEPVVIHLASSPMLPIPSLAHEIRPAELANEREDSGAGATDAGDT